MIVTQTVHIFMEDPILMMSIEMVHNSVYSLFRKVVISFTASGYNKCYICLRIAFCTVSTGTRDPFPIKVELFYLWCQ